jgi:adenosylhomocysteinase
VTSSRVLPLANVVEFRADPADALRAFRGTLDRIRATGHVLDVTVESPPDPGWEAAWAVGRLALSNGGEGALVLSPASDPDAKLERTHVLAFSVTRVGGLDARLVHELTRAIEDLPFSAYELGEIRAQLPLTGSCVQFLGETALLGRALFLTIHHMTDFIPMIEALLALGVEPEDVTIIDKEYPYSLTRRVDAHLRHALGLSVYRYSELPLALSEHIERTRARGRDTIVVDDGGYVFPVLMRELPDRLGHFVGLVEQTMSGIWKLRGLDLPVPVFSVAESLVKSTVESYGIADAAIRNIIALRPHEKFEGQAAVVLGYGRIGRQMAAVLRTRRMRVAVHDCELVQMIAAHEEGFLTDTSLGRLLERHRPALIVGTAGANSLTGEHVPHLRRDCFLASTTSRDYEFNLADFAEAATSVTRLGKLGTSFVLENDVEVIALGHGFPINFHYAESLPNRYVDLVIACLISGAATLAWPAHEFSPGNTYGNLELTNRILGASPILQEYYERYGPEFGDDQPTDPVTATPDARARL